MPKRPHDNRTADTIPVRTKSKQSRRIPPSPLDSAVGRLPLCSVFITLLLTLLVWPPDASAQSPLGGSRVEEQTPDEQLEAVAVGDTVTIILGAISSSYLEGVVVQQDLQSIAIESPNGSTRTFDRSIIYAVVSMEQAAIQRRKRLGELEAARPDFAGTRLIAAPTGRVGAPGGLVIHSLEPFFPYVNYTPFSSFEIRAGSSILPMTVQEFYGGAKAKLWSQKTGSGGAQFTISGGAFGGLSSNYFTVEAKDEVGALLFGVATYDVRAEGNSEGERGETTALTIGAGYLLTGGFIQNGAAVMAGFEHRRGGRFKFLAESAVLEASRDVLFGAGLRYITRRVTAGGGLYTGTPFFGGTLPALPVITVGYRVL